MTEAPKTCMKVLARVGNAYGLHHTVLQSQNLGRPQGRALRVAYIASLSSRNSCGLARTSVAMAGSSASHCIQEHNAALTLQRVSPLLARMSSQCWYANVACMLLIRPQTAPRKAEHSLICLPSEVHDMQVRGAHGKGIMHASCNMGKHLIQAACGRRIQELEDDVLEVQQVHARHVLADPIARGRRRRAAASPC